MTKAAVAAAAGVAAAGVAGAAGAAAAAAAAAQRWWGRMTKAGVATTVGKDGKGGGSLFLYGVVVKKMFCVFINFDVWQGGHLSGWPFCSRYITRVGFLF
jgi:hypothetical protein